VYIYILLASHSCSNG